MITLAVEAMLGTLLALTLTITRGDRVSLTLAGAFAASVIVIPFAPDHTVALTLCDFAVVYGMRMWCSGPQAYFVGLIGFAKIMTRTVFYLNGSSGFWYASAINMAFAMQLLIAGGLCDGLGHMLRRKFPRWSGMLEYVSG